jgi:two-component system chemotaxis response regulator CheY
MPTAIIIDDSPIMRAQLRRLLIGSDFTIVAEAGDAQTLLELYARHRPDLVSLDIVMPGLDGATAATQLLAQFPEAKIVMCTSLSSRDKVIACQKAGVAHYLLKPINPDHAATVFKAVLSDAAGK